MRKISLPKFWKLSHGASLFSYDELRESIDKQLAYVHIETKGKGTQNTSQADSFINATIGDYFYLTHGNTGIYLLGQFTGPVNYFSPYSDGWMSRKYDIIARSILREKYNGEQKYWTPNDFSTFQEIPKGELHLFEDWILKPYFNITFKKYGIEI